ncbi:MAG: T9SS type A sorting domain-containing protein [Flavobacteriaceae bacterium]|nr:T9SS type A sorting domain-containing protein [Flavobacteriaceae bacterium]
MKKLLLFTLISLFSLAEAQAQIPEDGLMGRYELDNGTYVDATANGYDLAPIGTGTLLPADDRFGEPMKALLFVEDYLTLASAPGVFDFDSENAISLAAWIKIDQTVIDWTGLLNNWAGFDAGGYYLGLTPTQQIRWNVNADEVIDTDPVPTGVWMHVVAAFDGTTSRVYLDGILTSIAAPSADLTPSVFPFVVGSQSDNDTNKFPGTIDEILVYNRALSDQEVVDIYENVPLSINDASALAKNIKLSPNPTSASFSMTYDASVLGALTSMEITDMKGSVLLRIQVTELNQTVDVNFLKSGVYHLTFTSEYGAKYTKQLLKK